MWVDFLGVCLEVGGGGGGCWGKGVKITSCLKLARIMLGTSNLA